MSTGEKGFKTKVHWDLTVQPYFTAAFGAPGLEALSQTLCRPPLINNLRVNLDKVTLEVGQSLSKLGAIAVLSCAGLCRSRWIA